MAEIATIYPSITSFPAYANHLAMTDLYLKTSSREAYMNWFIEQYTSMIYYYSDSHACQAVFDNVFGSNPLHTSEILYFENFGGKQLCRDGGLLSDFYLPNF